jgi:cytochrome c-type biogenesis protein CcmH
VKLAFVVAVVLMVLIAIGAVVVPLLRRGRQQGRPRSVFALALFVIVAVPLVTLGLYLKIGTPATLDGVATQPPAMNIDQALADLRAHLAQQPDDLQGWLLLAQTTTAMHQPAAARDAYDHALKIDAGNADAMVGWAEADSMLQPTHVIGERARQLLQTAVGKQPDNQRGLWLLGISRFQQNEFADAAATWRHLLPLLQPGSAVANAVADQIKAADARSGGVAATAPNADTPALSRNKTHSAALQVNVQLAPALKTRIGRGGTLFIYARAPSGPPMPLAVTRMDANTLPVSVTLTDAMAMTPQRSLSSAPRVFVGARISHSGQAIAQPGDLEGDAGVVAVDATQPILITIDKVH